MPIKEQAEAADLMAEMNAEFRRLFPSCPPESLKVDKPLLTAVSLLRRDIAVANKRASLASLTSRDLDKFSRHDPKDQE